MMMMKSYLIGSLLTFMCTRMVVSQTTDLLGREPLISCSITNTLQAEDFNEDGNDPQVIFCGDLRVDGGGRIELGGGQDTILSTGFCDIGILDLGNVSMGDGKDTLRCGDTLSVMGRSALDLGNGDDFVSVQSTNNDGCFMGGMLHAGNGSDTLLFSTTDSSSCGLSVSVGTLDLGNGRDMITANTAGTTKEACLIISGGRLYGGKGADTLNCIGGSVGLQVTGIDSTLDMGDGADTIYSQNDIVITNGGQMNLGNGNDNVTTDGCLRGTVNMGNGTDSVFAKAASGTIRGGNGRDCYQPTTSGEYILTCNGGVATLTAPNDATCNGANAPAVTLESVERIGCAETGYVDVPSCGDLPMTFDFPLPVPPPAPLPVVPPPAPLPVGPPPATLPVIPQPAPN